jgi:guanine nucleotide-binding protein subunit beta
MPPKSDSETVGLRAEIEGLKEKIKTAQTSVSDSTLLEVCSTVDDVPKLRLGTKRLLKGHIHKVNEIYFSGDSR